MVIRQGGRERLVVGGKEGRRRVESVELLSHVLEMQVFQRRGGELSSHPGLVFRIKMSDIAVLLSSLLGRTRRARAPFRRPSPPRSQVKRTLRNRERSIGKISLSSETTFESTSAAQKLAGTNSEREPNQPNSTRQPPSHTYRATASLLFPSPPTSSTPRALPTPSSSSSISIPSIPLLRLPLPLQNPLRPPQQRLPSTLIFPLRPTHHLRFPPQRRSILLLLPLILLLFLSSFPRRRLRTRKERKSFRSVDVKVFDDGDGGVLIFSV